MHPRTQIRLAIMTACISIFFSISAPEALCKAPAPSPSNAAAADPASSFSQDNNVFALDLYRHMRTSDGNIFFSPYSIRTALAMTYAGARGETAVQMRNALQFTQDGDVLHRSFADSITALNTGGGTDYEMSVANSLWCDKTTTFLQPFIDVNQNYYDGALQRVDFRNETESARLQINAWVEDQTRRKITNLLAPRSLSADTRLVLVNAVYFKGLWLEQFDKQLTRPEPFYCADGRIITAPLMTFAEPKRMLFHRDNGLKMIELGYQGNDISMLVILPETPDGLAAIEEQLDTEMLDRLIAGLQPQRVSVFLPRFTLTWGAKNMVLPLRSLGMHDAFEAGAADFSGIDGTRDLLISGVFHKAFVDVNEEGTEAAAATGVVVGVTSMPPPPEEFRADRPFLFFIREKATGAILFMGRLAEPQP